MAGELLNRGRNLFAQHQGNSTPLVINKFVLALVPGLNPATAINLDEDFPPSGQIVGEFVIPAENRGYVNPDRVVFSMILPPTVGPFSFNWVGLLAENGMLVAVSHVPTQQKYATSGGVLGNTLTRNFLVEYQNAQSITGVTVEAGTWQVDFTARYNQQQELMRNIAQDFYGKQFFMDDGFKVVRSGGAWKVSPGIGYVGGIRIQNNSLATIDVAALPADVWVDVYIDKNLSSVEPVFTIAALPAGTAFANYTASNGTIHHVAKIATLTNTTVYADNRRKTASSDTGILGGQQNDWAAFLAAFGGRTDFTLLTVNTPLTRNSKYFSLGALSHTLPNSSQALPEGEKLYPGDVIRVLKKAGEAVAYFVQNIASDLIYFDGDVDTSINHNLDVELVFLWTGSRWECSI